MKRDLYAEVSARIIAELETGAAPWIKPWSATPGANTRPESEVAVRNSFSWGTHAVAIRGCQPL
jgi:antirestriction protein ArdC